ncbi:MAG: SCP2 sterol-binding domain-containing protein [Betaproteobacteria bacterium]|uniref:Putative sterol carrier protein n=1 Tax=Thiomonas delicata TaxID=364030 RepID=A0A238D6C2_THIDL|nr:SCP2 sterol-binding domain-containing protein [Thiomonas delicata]MDE2128755.1 SCP2 sterol-binding domain-containing protein [Betaproteobacteria bacterium]SBP88761.1 putative sterol carrier protein [Thiomonas delicata]
MQAFNPISRKHLVRAALTALFATTAVTAQAAPVLMSPQWTASFCQAWNQTPQLTEGLAGEWLHDDKGRGYKIVEMYRTDCGKGSMVELKIVPKDGKAYCTYGGAPNTPANFDVDFLMHASTKNWESMGKGDPGPMWAMMSGKLEFQGPKLVAMRAIKPFESFLLMVGKVPGDAGTCPAASTQTSAAK